MSESKTTSNEISLEELLDEADRRQARKDPVFFIEHYLKTFDPRPEAFPHHLDFKLYDYQRDYVLGTVDAILKGYDIFDEKSRDMGASWLALAVRFWLWLTKDTYQGLIGSRKEEYVDDGTLKSLFPKIDYFIENIKDPLLLPRGFDTKKHRTYMKLINPETGATITGESSNKNFSRAGRFDDVLFDELGFWPDARSSWTAAGDATRCRHAVTTPPDEPSFAKTLRFSDKIKVRTWHWRLHPKKDQDWYEYEKSRRTEEEVLHEIDISWEYSSIGKPYPEIKLCPVDRYPYNPNMPLYRVLDIGLDAVAIGYYQPVINSDWLTLVDAYENYDKVIDWYMPFFGKDIDNRFIYTEEDLAFIDKIKLWKPGTIYGDPSGNSRHVESKVSPYQIMKRDYGLQVFVNVRENAWKPRWTATKRILPRLRINDTPGTKWFIDCVSSARYPKRDEETSQSVTPIMQPVHDWTSHHRTQLEFFSVNYRPMSDFDGGYVSTPSARQRLPQAIGQELISDSLNAILDRGNQEPEWTL
jgi:hypothetical protein